MAQRPGEVPADATIIYPGQTFGPGLGVQMATLTAISAQIMAMNAAAQQRYAGALKDWIANAQIYAAYGMQIPPAPQAPSIKTLNVRYADAAGEIVNPPAGADGLHYAWIWES